MLTNAICLAAGAVLLLGGLWLMWPPLSLAVAGASLVTVALTREISETPKVVRRGESA